MAVVAYLGVAVVLVVSDGDGGGRSWHGRQWR